MSNPSEAEIRGRLIGILSDGFNRSINALRESGAIDTRKLDRDYRGVGTKYYDVVTEAIEYTAKQGARSLLSLVEDSREDEASSDESPDE